MSGDPEQEYFSDGITEDIITDLSKVSGLAGHRPQHRVHLQGQSGKGSAGSAGARRSLHPGRKCAQSRGARPGHGTAHQQREQRSRLGRPL